MGRTRPISMAGPNPAHHSWLLCMSTVTSFPFTYRDVHRARPAWRGKKRKQRKKGGWFTRKGGVAGGAASGGGKVAGVALFLSPLLPSPFFSV